MPLRLPQRGRSKKIATATGDLIGNKIAEKITKAATKSTYEDPKKSATTQTSQLTSVPKEIHIPPVK